MGAVLFLALKDIFKNKKILLMIILVIGMGVAASLTFSGLFHGFTEYFNSVTVDVITGHLTISPEDDDEYLSNVRNIERKLELLPEVIGVSPRLNANAIALRKTKESQVRIIGLSPSKEIKATRIAEQVSKGEFLSDNDNEILLGSELADNLNADVGKTIQLTFRNGNLEEYKVKGFLDTGARSGDEVSVYMSNKELERILDVEDSASQIIIRLSNIDLVEKAKLNILQQGIDGEVRTWKELSSYVEGITRNFNFIFGFINLISLVASAVAVAVVMFINVENKIREIGILKAIGGRNSFIMKVFLTEVLLYAVFGVIMGNVLGFLITAYFQAFPSMQFVTAGSGSIAIVPIIHLSDMIRTSVTVFIVTIIAGIYPIRMATRLDIIKAIRKG
ncbi:MAG: ABC transporter permease [Methanosarcinales archaeon]|nr:ABC transporter permease [Methanosarcinales archaeon]